MERLEAVVSGRVQMVMYRDYTQRKGSGLKLVGEVQNLPDGTVRVVAEGSRQVLEAFLQKLEKGSLLSRVESIAPAWTSPKGEYTRFTINYD